MDLHVLYVLSQTPVDGFPFLVEANLDIAVLDTL